MGYEELRNETDRLSALRAAAHNELRHLRSVRGVGIGVRQVNGMLTGELAFRVYVDQKRARTQLARADVVPRCLFGFPTDVHDIVRARRECCGATRPLLAGIAIECSSFSQLSAEQGTLGCFLSLADGRTVALTNEHVLKSASELTGQHAEVYQPRLKRFAGAICNEIGKSLGEVGLKGDFQFNGQTHYLDCAVVELKEVDFINAMVAVDRPSPGVAVPLPAGVVGSVTRGDDGRVVELKNGSGVAVDTTKILGSAAAVPNTLVWKVGASTGLTVGLVEAINAPSDFNDGPFPVHGQNQIIVRPIAGFYVNPQTRENAFSQGGDSGSVYMDLQNRVVGLHHHGSVGGQGRFSIGSDIAAVLSHLGGATVLQEQTGTTHSTSAPSTQLARELWAGSTATVHNLDALEAELRRRVSHAAGGQVLLELVDRHLAEILQLVWHRREVTIAWHRHHGPAFVVLFARALTRPDGSLPREAGGVSRRALLGSMADVLVAHGSPALRADLEALRPWLLELLAESSDVGELCHRLEERAA